MIRLSRFAVVILSGFIGLNACTNKLYQDKTRVQVESVNLKLPLLRRADTNPLLRLTVRVPAGKTTLTWKEVSLTVNSLNDLDKVEVYFTGTDSVFNAKNLSGSLKPASKNFKIPLDLKLAGGKQYVWISATAKETASVGNNLVIEAKNVKEASGVSQSIVSSNGIYKHPVGIAIRKPGDDGVNSYRIPGIATTDKGSLIAVYDIRYKNSADLPGNIDVGMSRSTDGGQTWEPMKVIMDMGEPHENNGVGDPAILFDPATRKIWVVALWSKGNKSIRGSKPGLSPEETGQFAVVSSDDDGKTWSEPYSITAQVKNPKWNLFFNGPGNGFVMQDGKLVFAAQYWDENEMPHSTIIYSDDHGKNWKSGIGAKSNTTESQVIETTPGTLMLNMRDNRGKFRSVATTTDFGKTWTEHKTSYHTLIDPVCMGSLIKVKVNVKGTLKEVVFFSNPNSSKNRNNITIKASLDLGETWLPGNQLLIDQRDCYGYSALTKIDDNTLGILYEGVRDLYFVRVPVKDIIK